MRSSVGLSHEVWVCGQGRSAEIFGKPRCEDDRSVKTDESAKSRQNSFVHGEISRSQMGTSAWARHKYGAIMRPNDMDKFDW